MTKINGLSLKQEFAKTIFDSPKGAFRSRIVKNIYYNKDYSRIKIASIVASFYQRMWIAALPAFAVGDFFRFSGKSIKNLFALKLTASKKNLQEAARSLIFSLCVIPSLPFSLQKPTMVFRTPEKWEHLKQEQLKLKIEKTITDKLDLANFNKNAFQNRLNETLDLLIISSATKNYLKEFLVTPICNGIPENLETSEIVIKEYTSFFTSFISQSIIEKIPLNNTNDAYCLLLKEICEMRNPELRTQALFKLNQILKNESDKLVKCIDFCKKNDLKRYCPILFALISGPKDSTLQDLCKILRHKNFKDHIKTNKLIDCFINYAKNDSAKNANGLDLFINNLTNSLVQAPKTNTNKKLEELEIKLKYNQKQLNNPDIDNTKIEKKINGLNRAIEKIKGLNKAQVSNTASDIKGDPLKIIKTFEWILALDDKEQISEILKNIGTEKKFKSLSDDTIIFYVFNKVFDFEKAETSMATNLLNQRDPGSFLLFHSRLKELKGRTQELALEASKKFVEASLKGTLWEERHNKKNNPHLKHIFNLFPKVETKWKTPKTAKISNYIDSNLAKKFSEYSISETQDPCDLILLGSEMNTCVHLRGRLRLVHGLLGFALDGKIHTIVVKDSNGKINAETQLVLMWDDQNKKPVLFMDEINYNKHSETDESLQNGIKKFCIERGKELDCELVSYFGSNNSRSKKKGAKYNGTIKSLGSSSPVEYVNVFARLITGVYKLPTSFLVK